MNVSSRLDLHHQITNWDSDKWEQNGRQKQTNQHKKLD